MFSRLLSPKPPHRWDFGRLGSEKGLGIRALFMQA